MFLTIFAFMYNSYCIPPAYPNIKTTVKIAKSKPDIFKVPRSVPYSEVRGPRLVSDLAHADFSHSMRPWMFRFKLVLIVHFLIVYVVSAVACGERIRLSTISPPEAALMKIDKHRRK